MRLTRDIIIDAAVAVAAQGKPDGLTGRVLGDHLGVDRSAIWRHFHSSDDLLLAVGDRLLVMVAARVDRDLGPAARLKEVARVVVEVFVAHPYVGSAVACRVTRGPGELALVEMMLSALQERELSTEAVARFQRTFADAVLSYAGMRAGYALLSPEIQTQDEWAWAGHYVSAATADHPAFAQHGLALANVTDDLVLETLLNALEAAVDAEIAQLRMSGQGHR